SKNVRNGSAVPNVSLKNQVASRENASSVTHPNNRKRNSCSDYSVKKSTVRQSEAAPQPDFQP
ncbi:hypothetical protein SB748_30480, partial [Rhizobium sp. SIMBA_035]